jgi:peptidyl-prolyl cis-trans isomerase D
MLMAIRERVMGLLGWVLLGALFVTFAFFGLNSYFTSNAKSFAASVNDVEIPLSEQQRVYQSLRNALQERLGQNYNPALVNEAMLKRNALDQLVRQQLLLQAAEANGFAISKELIAARINSIPAFRDGAVFSSDKYQRVLRLQGIAPAEFEWRLGRELMTSQLVNGITQSAAASPDTIGKLLRLQTQQRRFAYLRIPVADYADQVTASDSEIEQYYASHTDQFMTPERVKIQYLELAADKLQVTGEADEAALRALYDEQAERYVKEEERQVRQILIAVPQDADKAAVEAARERAASVMERLQQGESFAVLAKQESDDPDSAAKGGDLGFFRKKDLEFFGPGLQTPSFADTAFSLEQGARSDIIRTPFGFHIIEVLAIRPRVATPFADVREELEKQYFQQERNDLFYDKMDTLANLTFEQPDTLQGAADALDLEIQTSDWLTRDGGPGIGANQAVISAAFSEEVLEAANNSEPIELGENDVAVVRILEHESAMKKPLADVREEVTAKVIGEKARVLVSDLGETLLGELESGTPLAESAKSRQLELKESGLVGRNSTTPQARIVREAFLLAPPSENRVSATGFALDSGDYVVLSLEEIKDGDLSAMSGEQRNNLVREIDRILGTSELAALVDELRNQATIIIPEQAN